MISHLRVVAQIVDYHFFARVLASRIRVGACYGIRIYSLGHRSFRICAEVCIPHYSMVLSNATFARESLQQYSSSTDATVI